MRRHLHQVSHLHRPVEVNVPHVCRHAIAPRPACGTSEPGLVDPFEDPTSAHRPALARVSRCGEEAQGDLARGGGGRHTGEYAARLRETVGVSRLPSGFYDRPVLDVAVDLLGARISHGGVTIRLTEVEAYAGVGDPGSHAFRGETPRTTVMFGAPGGLYVYFTYGMHWCANLVCGPDGQASAVLMRAGEVVDGEEIARTRRGEACATRDLARGPARLASALGLTGEVNGTLTFEPDSPVRVQAAAEAPDPARIRTGPRVGVSGPGGDGTAYPWRFWIDGEATVSVYRPGKPRRRP